jgi:hypothetical protein
VMVESRDGLEVVRGEGQPRHGGSLWHGGGTCRDGARGEVRYQRQFACD